MVEVLGIIALWLCAGFIGVYCVLIAVYLQTELEMNDSDRSMATLSILSGALVLILGLVVLTLSTFYWIGKRGLGRILFP